MEFEEKQEPCTEYGADDHLNKLYEIFRDRTKTDKKSFEMFYGEVLKNVEEMLK